jgi:hypothetical protein
MLLELVGNTVENAVAMEEFNGDAENAVGRGEFDMAKWMPRKAGVG